MAKEDNNIEPEQQQETAAAMSKKDSYMKGFREKHPDWQDDDEEGFYGTLSDEAAANEEKMKGYQDREDELSKALSGNVLNAAILMDAVNGKPIPVSLLERYPDEVRAWMDDPSNADQLKKVMEEHAKKIDENKKLQEEANANLEESNRVIDEMIASGEVKDEEEVNSLLQFLGNIANGLMMNHVEKEWLIAAKNAMNHDSDVEKAKAQGEIAGRNQKINAKRMEASNGTGNHPGVGSSNSGRGLTPQETRSAFRGNRGGGSMWDGMKTTKLN